MVGDSKYGRQSFHPIPCGSCERSAINFARNHNNNSAIYNTLSIEKNINSTDILAILSSMLVARLAGKKSKRLAVIVDYNFCS